MIGVKLAERYEVLGELGRGGMGVVYRARDPLLDREVAIKIVPPTLITPDAELRFQREAQVVAKMDHPAIVTVYDIGRHDGALFFVMPVVHGTHLRSLLRERTLKLGDVVDIGIQVADALDYSHTQGVIHRDIKPENIMVRRTETGGVRVRIMDFGLARASIESQLTRITQSGTLVGTVSYFSPEQVSATHDVDVRSDLYSLGTVLYECLLGEPPFAGEVQSVLYRIVHETPQTPSARGADVDAELERIAMHCIARDPSNRPQTAREVAEALTRYRRTLSEENRQRPIATAATRAARPEPYQREVVPFIGRERELTELQHRLNAAIAGECQFVVVGGDQGFGKSRLLEELERLARARRILVLHGRFVEQDRSFPYQGFCEAIQEYFRWREANNPSNDYVDFSDLAAELTHVFPVLAEIGDIKSASTDSRSVDLKARRIEDRTTIFELLARALARIAAGKPLVLLLEDLHDADVSIEALQYVVRRLGPTPTLIIGTYRSGDVDRRHAISRMLDSFYGDRRFAHVTLGPFSASEHRAYIAELVGGARVGDVLAKTLYEATEGNPFFTRELVRSLVDSGGIAEDDVGTLSLSSEMGLTSDAIPETIQQVVEKQIERLDEAERDTLSMAAVLGRAFEYRDLEALAEGRQDLEDTIDRLLRQGLIEEDRESRSDRLAFTSGVVRESLYASMARRRRRTLHRRCAEWIERRHAGKERYWGILAHHFSQGDVGEKAVEYGLKSARKSLEAFSSEEALRSARIALEFLEDEEWEGERWYEGEARMLLAAAYRIEGNIEGALREIERALRVFERERDTLRIVDTHLAAAETAWEGRRIEDTRRWVERGIEVARGIDHPEPLSRLLSLGATVANLRGEYEAARDFLEEVERLKPDVAGDARRVDGGSIVVGLAGPCLAREPAIVQTVEEEEVIANVFERLFTTDDHGNLAPLLCERWEVRDDGRSIVITLRPNIRFTDGHVLTAEDVKHSFERAIRRDDEGLRAAFAIIEGVAEARRDGAGPDVSGLVVLDTLRLEVRLTERLPIYPALLSDQGTGIVRVIPGGSDQPESVIGTGAFKVAEWATDRVVLERNDSYWGSSKPALDRVTFVASLNATDAAARFRSGEIHIARELFAEDLERFLRDTRLRPTFVEAARKNACFAVINSRSSVITTPEMRRALAGVIRTQNIVWQSLGRFAVPATGIIPPAMLGHDPGRRRPALSVEQASEMIGGGERPIRIRAAISPGIMDRYGTLIKNLSDVWALLGIHVDIPTLKTKKYLAAFNDSSDFDLVVCRWNADYDDPDNFTYGLFHSRIGALREYFHSPETDAIAEEARAEHRPAIRETLYRKFENVMLDAGAVMPLFHEVNYLLAKRNLRGLAVRSGAPYVDYAGVWRADEEEISRQAARRTSGGIIYAPAGAILVDTLDPVRVSSIGHGEVTPNIFETLTRVVEGARVVPWLASHVSVENGGMRFGIRLRDDVRFHDGRRLSARDVRYSFERFLLHPECSNRSLLAPIRGARAMIAGEAGDLEGFRILSAQEFTLELESPLMLFEVFLANPATAIVPEGSGNFESSWREHCTGTGPFRVLRFEPGIRLELERNADYWRAGSPKCDGLVFSFGMSSAEILAEFRSGRLSLATDLAPADVDALRHDSGFAAGYREMPRLATSILAFNTQRGPLADAAFRRRLVQSINISSIVRRVLGRYTMPANGFIPPGLLGYEPVRRTTGPLAMPIPLEAPLELNLATTAPFTGRYKELTSELLEVFRRLGIRVQLTSMSTEKIAEIQRSGIPDMTLTTWVADYPDSDSFARGVLHSVDGILGVMCGSQELDAFIDRGREHTDPAVRHFAYRQVEEIIAREALLLPLFHPRNYRFARPDVEGLAIASYTYPSVAYENLWVK